MTDMTIGKAAQEAGVGVETIRFYQRKGLIEQPAKPGSGGFRSYPRETIERIQFIRQAQELGFSLREVHELLSLHANPSADCTDVREQARAKLEEVDQKIGHLQKIAAALGDLIAACPGKGALHDCSILTTLSARGNQPGGNPNHRPPS